MTLNICGQDASQTPAAVILSTQTASWRRRMRWGWGEPLREDWELSWVSLWSRWAELLHWRENDCCASGLTCCLSSGNSRRNDISNKNSLQGPVRWCLGRTWDRLHTLCAEGCASDSWILGFFFDIYPKKTVSILCLSTGCWPKSRSQWDQKPLLRDQRRAQSHAGEGQAQGAGGHALVQPHRRHFPLQVVGQHAQPKAVHGSQQHPSHVTTTTQRLLRQGAATFFRKEGKLLDIESSS